MVYAVMKNILAPIVLSSIMTVSPLAHASSDIGQNSAIENIVKEEISEAAAINKALDTLDRVVDKIVILCEQHCSVLEENPQAIGDFEKEVVDFIAEDFKLDTSIFKIIKTDIQILEGMRIDRPILFINIKGRSIDLFDNFQQNPDASKIGFSAIAQDIFQFQQDYLNIVRTKAATDSLLAEAQITYMRFLSLNKKLQEVIKKAPAEFGPVIVASQFLGNHVMQPLEQELSNRVAVAQDIRNHYAEIDHSMQEDLQRSKTWLPVVAKGIEGDPSEALVILPTGIEADLLDAEALLNLGLTIELSSEAGFQIAQRRKQMIAQNKVVVEKARDLFEAAARKDKEAAKSIFDHMFDGIENSFREIDKLIGNIEREIGIGLENIKREVGRGLQNSWREIGIGLDNIRRETWKGFENVLREAKHGYCELTEGSQDDRAKDHNGDGQNDDYQECMEDEERFQIRATFNTKGDISAIGGTFGDIPIDIPFESESDRRQYKIFRQKQAAYIKEFNESIKWKFRPDARLSSELTELLTSKSAFVFEPADVLFTQVDSFLVSTPALTVGKKTFIDHNNIAKTIKGVIADTEAMIKELEGQPLGNGRYQVATGMLAVKFTTDFTIDMLSWGTGAGLADEAAETAINRLGGVLELIGVIDDFNEGRDASITLVLNQIPFMNSINTYFALESLPMDYHQARKANKSSIEMLKLQIKKYQSMLERIEQGLAPIDRANASPRLEKN